MALCLSTCFLNRKWCYNFRVYLNSNMLLFYMTFIAQKINFSVHAAGVFIVISCPVVIELSVVCVFAKTER